MSAARTVTFTVVLTLLVATLGGWLGVRYGLRQASATPGLDQVLHHDISLSPEQEQRIASLEAGFAARRKVLEGEMHAANADLAAAIVSEHRYGPAAEQAIDRFHTSMKTLQQETIMHVLAMRAVLTADQAQKFDQTVSKVLNSDPS